MDNSAAVAAMLEVDSDEEALTEPVVAAAQVRRRPQRAARSFGVRSSSNTCWSPAQQVKTKHELDPVAVQPPPIDPDSELVPCGVVCSVIGALATVKATADVQPVDAVCVRITSTAAARDSSITGHCDMPIR
jgi:hypothetical protein